jgi:hypothetical protein
MRQSRKNPHIDALASKRDLQPKEYFAFSKYYATLFIHKNKDLQMIFRILFFASLLSIHSFTFAEKPIIDTPQQSHEKKEQDMYTPQWPHGAIEEIFPNIFMVTGTNKTKFESANLQFSRNMIIVRDDKELSLINTVRLSEEGLKSLDELGKVTKIISIGAFHGRDDAFYIDYYKAKFWVISKCRAHGHDEKTVVEMTPNGPMPFPNSTLFVFDSKCSEGIIHINQDGGVLITCDSIQNWTSTDQYFNEETKKSFTKDGLIKKANIPATWKGACGPKAKDFARLKKLKFKHLLSAHGSPLKDEAHELISANILKDFGV